jgi:hypothetical protein
VDSAATANVQFVLGTVGGFAGGKLVPNFSVTALNELANEKYAEYLKAKPEKSGGADEEDEGDEPRKKDTNGDYFPEDKSSE